MRRVTTFHGPFRSIWNLVLEVLFFWQLKLYAWLVRKPPKEALIETLSDAKLFEEWEASAYQLDELLGNDLWRQNPTSKHYDYRLIHERLQAIFEAREDQDMLGLVNLLRCGLVRNLGNITTPRLFRRAYAGTKLLIEDYITQVALAIEHVSRYPTSPGSGIGLTSQAKLDLLHDTRQAFGKTALLLQGGAIFGLCHIGVVKALYLQGLLPRVIVGTATGALVAALVGSHNDDELLDFLTGDGIDLSAFATRTKKRHSQGSTEDKDHSGWFSTLQRRVKRFIREGYFLDVKVLEECVRDNIGDLTFQEAYTRSKRMLNITVSSTGEGGVPTLLNYLTSPTVLIWSAAAASNAVSSTLYSPVTLLCKDAHGRIQPWSSTTADVPSFRSRAGSLSSSSQRLTTPSTAAIRPSDLRDSPLSRVTELFNVNHFIVSQARPYIAPFLQTGDVLSHAIPRHATTRRRSRFWLPLLRVLVLELQHRLRQLDALGLLHGAVRGFLIDEFVPGASLTLVPELALRDFVRLLERPTKKGVEEWILRGERSVWPAVASLKIRCAVEVKLECGYQEVRRRKPMDAVVSAIALPRDPASTTGQLRGVGEKRKRAKKRSSDGVMTGSVAKTNGNPASGTLVSPAQIL